VKETFIPHGRRSLAGLVSTSYNINVELREVDYERIYWCMATTPRHMVETTDLLAIALELVCLDSYYLFMFV
jgi:hypothetical protein